MRAFSVALVCAFSTVLVAQYPLVTSLEVRIGQRRPSVQHVVQDGQGLLWTVSDVGLVRTDGERMEVMYRSGKDRVQAIGSFASGIAIVTDNGVLVRCAGGRCDTLTVLDELGPGVVRSLVVAGDDSFWIGTYGNGVVHWSSKGLWFLDASNGLPDDHVNGMALLPDGRLVAATDQGLALIAGDKVAAVMGEAQGAPDNLTLCVEVSSEGAIWAGTDRRGVFRWKPDEPGTAVSELVKNWSFGPVRCIVAAPGMVWAGTADNGPIAIDEGLEHGTYRSAQAFGRPVMDLLTDREGAVWWCDGTELLHRADPAILVVPEHEGIDLRHITAICADGKDRIWFATPDGLFQHAAWFSDERKVARVPVPLDKRNPIVSLAADDDATIWAATFGGGVIALLDNGPAIRYTKRDGLSNDNVLAARQGNGRMLFATLEGITRFDGTRFHPVAQEAGFNFDVAEVAGSIYTATDGRGVLRVGQGTLVPVALEGRTCYTLTTDPSGGFWTIGPGTGFCRLSDGATQPIGADRPPFDGDVFALCAYGERLLAFGSTGVTALHLPTGRLSDVTAVLGLSGISAELNAVSVDRSGAIWFACSKGLFRLRPTATHFDERVPVPLLSATFGNEAVDLSQEVDVPHDRNTFTVRFAGTHYADPTAIQFEYRLIGQGDRPVRTSDRELTFAGLRPGTYTFQVRAFTSEEADQEAPWTQLKFTISPPWWRTNWALVAAIVIITTLIWAFIRTREGRLRYRERMEQEKVRFQLEALRSKVDPHFLFNSFTALVELIETKPEVAVEHVDQLSTFFRNILLVRDRERISVHEEVRLLENYFALEQRRFGPAIQLLITSHDEGMDRGIVPLTLQMLVENALKHNVISRDGVFVVSVRVENDAIVVSNPVHPRLTPPRSTGFGLHSIVARYAALTERPVTVERNEREFSVRIPLIALTP